MMELKKGHIYLVKQIRDWRGEEVESAPELARYSMYNELSFFGSDEFVTSCEIESQYEIIREIVVPELL